ncbi:MAG TPA: DNA/RNA non-specific endonuclease [Candidatus Enterenecus stercoripullorum]|nr:DNA/RNA non-specific endonuclease [Candidatus Enterenecus stercoripullorum]
MNSKRSLAALLWSVSLLLALLCGCQGLLPAQDSHQLEDIPGYSGEPYVILADNQPDFDLEDFTTDAFESYSQLDYLGRCGVAYANVGLETMPTQDRESISEVEPTGWINAQYEFVDGGYLYNRCHLIGFQLTGENANERNLITGTRYMNVEGMLPFENMVADYVSETGNHVLYRVTPLFEGANLLASGVQMEAISVEDEGEGVCFNVYVYNVQPGVEINYATGANQLDESAFESGETQHYVLNTSSKRFHLPDCSSVADMNESNRQDYEGARELLIAQGYQPCGNCNP